MYKQNKKGKCVQVKHIEVENKIIEEVLPILEPEQIKSQFPQEVNIEETTSSTSEEVRDITKNLEQVKMKTPEEILDNLDNLSTIDNKYNLEHETVSNVVESLYNNENNVFSQALNLLDDNTKRWVSSLTSNELSSLFRYTYALPSLLPYLSHQENKTSSEIGKLGEDNFYTTVQNLPEGYIVETTSKANHQGDFVIVLEADNRLYKCLVDIKRYKTTVPTSQIIKFYSDLSNGNYDCGLFISQTSKITNMKSIDLEVYNGLHGPIPIMYLSEIPDEIMLKCIQMIFAKTRIMYSRITDTSRIENLILFANNTLQNLVETRALLQDLNNTMSKSIMNCQQKIMTVEAQAQSALSEITRTISYNVPNIQPRDDNVTFKSIDGTINEKKKKIKKVQTIQDVPDPEIQIDDTHSNCDSCNGMLDDPDNSEMSCSSSNNSNESSDIGNISSNDLQLELNHIKDVVDNIIEEQPIILENSVVKNKKKVPKGFSANLENFKQVDQALVKKLCLHPNLSVELSDTSFILTDKDERYQIILIPKKNKTLIEYIRDDGKEYPISFIKCSKQTLTEEIYDEIYPTL